MKQIFSVVILAAMVSSFSSCATTRKQAISSATAATATASPTENVEQLLARMEQDWVDATIKGDIAFTDRILADDCIYINWDGSTETKTQVLESVKAGAYKAESMKLENIRVRAFNDSAVVTYGQIEKSQTKGKDSSGHYIYTDVWVKRNGKWQIVASHGCKTAQPKV
ncbi:MAG: nuclear transport factor 2 family protein [Blastocatellia bacterium]